MDFLELSLSHYSFRVSSVLAEDLELHELEVPVADELVGRQLHNGFGAHSRPARCGIPQPLLPFASSRSDRPRTRKMQSNFVLTKSHFEHPLFLHEHVFQCSRCQIFGGDMRISLCRSPKAVSVHNVHGSDTSHTEAYFPSRWTPKLKNPRFTSLTLSCCDS